MTSPKDAFISSLAGITRGFIVNFFIHPLELIKTCQQTNLSREKTYNIAWQIFKSEGILGFYKGIWPQHLKTITKQAWSWPLITGLPKYIQNFTSNWIIQQTLTGFLIAGVDTSLTASMERRKILAMVGSKQRTFSFFNLKEGWKGIYSYGLKLMVSWPTFLVSQRFFRDYYQQESPDKKLSLFRLIDIGVKVAAIVSVTAAPVDFINTVNQTRNINIKEIILKISPKTYFLGWPMRFLSLTIHNVASVILIDKLAKV